MTKEHAYAFESGYQMGLEHGKKITPTETACKYCTPRMEIRGTVFYEQLPIPDTYSGYGGCLALRFSNGRHYLTYENDSSVFFHDVSLLERYLVYNCPMCGRRLEKE